jgi:hypothetical protein
MNDLDRELEAALAALRDEVLPERALASVRAGVHARIQSGRRKRVWTAWLSLAAAAVVAWIAVGIPWTAATLPSIAPRTPEVTSIALARPAIGSKRRNANVRLNAAIRGDAFQTAPTKKVRRNADDSSQQPPGDEQTQFMRIITDDPNVVILWAMNSKGETR